MIIIDMAMDIQYIYQYKCFDFFPKGTVSQDFFLMQMNVSYCRR